MTNDTKPGAYHWWLTALTTAVTIFQAGAIIRMLNLPPAIVAATSLNAPLEIAAAALWALLFAGITVNLIRRQSARSAILALGGFLIYSMVRLLLFAQADYDQNRLPFLTLGTVCLLVLMAATLLRR